MEPVLELSLEQLRGMIGLAVCYHGATCEVVEVLEDGPAVVLRDRRETAIQDDRFGDPHRRVAQTYTVPVVDEDGVRLHPEFLAMELLEPV